MGVPKFFRYISERYPCLSELVRENQVPEFDNLYLDMNGIIHNCSHPNDNDVHFRITEEQIFKDIFFYLETLFNMIKPQKLFFLAVDGVAPRAKMNQQRGRRFRSAKEAEVQEAKAREKGEVLPTEARFDSNCITPGTPFMCRLNNALRYFIQHKISTSKSWRDCTVILSGHETPGEGEHKIMEYIRYQKSHKGYDANTRHCLYGLDADLIMLGLCTHERHFSLLREEVKFGNKNNKTVSVSHQRFFLLHLSLMREYLEQEFITLKGNMKIPFDIEKIIDDWVLMGFLVGNDFIPNIPNLHINTNALPMLYEAYVKTMMNLDGYINEGGTLNLARLQAYIENLAQFDRDFFTSQYDDLKFLEEKHQGAFNERNDDTFGGNPDLMEMVKATEFEFDSSPDDDDEDDNGDEASFEKEFHQHRRNYYVNKMKYEEMTPEVLAEQAECYVRALQWTLAYYYHGVQSWSWYYPHHYAPYISDLKDFKNFKIKFDMSEPFLPFQQLMSVLPAASRAHVPECYKKLMTNPESDLIDFYPTDFETDLNGKKQEWEAVVLIPFIDEKRLLKSLERHDVELSLDEKARNVHGPMYVYTHASTSRGSLEAPFSFPSIGKLMCNEKKVFREEIQVPKEKLVLGPSKGAMLNVYFTGFPTFKHLNYESKLRHANVKVFDQPSRGDNMMVIVKHGAEMEEPLEVLAKQLLSKTVFVGWPHLMEAKIMSIGDKDNTFLPEAMEKADAQRFRHDAQNIKDHHIGRMGIDVGEISRIVRVVQSTGEEYRFDSKSKIFKLLKTYDHNEVAYPLQCIVQNIKAYRKKFQQEVPLLEAFKNGTEVFMLTNPYYGAFGEVINVSCYEKNGRVQVMLTVPQEPDFEQVTKLHDKSQGAYMNSYQTSATLSISENVFNRITGTVLVIAGNKRQISSEGTAKINIGLQLKFPKANEELAGYTKKDRIWLYSLKVISLVQEYYIKFPSIFEVLGKKTGNGNDIYFESDFFDTTHGDENLSTLTKWLAQLPHQKADRRQIGTESVEKEVLTAISETVGRSKEAALKKITMQVKPHLLYAPSLTQSTAKAPDVNSDYQLFDRVAVARDSEKYSIGMKGTVIGINRVKDLNPVRRECINKEDVYCEILFDGSPDDIQIGRVVIENLINVSFGESLTQTTSSNVKTPPSNRMRYTEKKAPREMVKPSQPPPPPTTNTISYSAILKNPAKNDDKKQNFSDMWNALKQGKEPEKGLSHKPSANIDQNLSESMATASLANINQLPVITAPRTLPTPPQEWLYEQQMKQKQEMPIQPVLQPQPPPQQIFYQNPLPLFQNGVQHHPFAPPQPMFFASNVNMQQQIRPAPQRFFHNNSNNFNSNGNNFNNINNFNNGNANNNQFFKRPQFQPRPPPMQYHQQPQPQQQQQPPSAHVNPFIPLQASRKATRGMNVQPVTSNAQKTDVAPQFREVKSLPDEAKAVEAPITSQSFNETEAKSINSRPPMDNRKSRLGISFGK